MNLLSYTPLILFSSWIGVTLILSLISNIFAIVFLWNRKTGVFNKISINHKNEVAKQIEAYQIMIRTLEDSTKKLAQSERETAWREMAQLVAHEIKNPLTPLKLGVQLLKKAWEEKDPDFDQKFEKFSSSFIEQIESLSLIASEFSNFAKMPDMVLERLDLIALIDQSVVVYQQIEGIKIQVFKINCRRIWIRADKNQLLRSFNNLIKNAMEALADRENGSIKIILQKDIKWAYIQITDNGSGINENLREKIFSPNFTTKTSGKGLGLAFVKQSLNSMGGTIQFTSSAKGTTFYIRIPLGRK